MGRIKVIGDVFALLISKAAFIGLRLLVLFCVASLAPKDIFGALSLAFTTAEICRYIADWGVDTWSLREFSNPKLNHARNYFLKVSICRIWASIFGVAFSFLLITQLTSNLDKLDQLLISTLTGSSLWLNISVNWLQARKKLKEIALKVGVLGVGSALFIIYLCLNNRAHKELIVVLTCSEWLIVALLFFSAKITDEIRLEDKSELKFSKIYKMTTPIAIAGLISLAYGRMDQYYVNENYTSQILADYVFSNRVAEPILFMAAAAASTLYARTSGVILGVMTDENEIKKYISKKLMQIAAYSTGASVFVAALIMCLIEFHFKQYASASEIILVVFLGAIFKCINLSLTAIIQAFGKYKIMLAINGINFISISATIFIIGKYGAVAIAAGVAVCEGVNTAMQYLVLIRNVNHVEGRKLINI